MITFKAVRAVVLFAVFAMTPAVIHSQTQEDRAQDRVAFPPIRSWAPGHTRCCTTWTMRIPDGGRTYDVLIACAGLQEDARLVNNKNYPEIAEDFARSIKTYKTLPADVFLGAHSWFFDLAGKYKRLGAAANPYVDSAGYKAWVGIMEKNYNTLLAEQKKNPPAN